MSFWGATSIVFLIAMVGLGLTETFYKLIKVGANIVRFQT